MGIKWKHKLISLTLHVLQQVTRNLKKCMIIIFIKNYKLIILNALVILCLKKSVLKTVSYRTHSHNLKIAFDPNIRRKRESIKRILLKITNVT